MKRTVLAVLVGAVLLTGCAIGKGPSGELVVGFDVGTAPETVSELGGAIASTFLGPQVGTLVAGVLATVLGVGGVGIAGSKLSGREKSRKRADQSREKAEKENAALRAIIQMFQRDASTPTPAPAAEVKPEAETEEPGDSST